MRRILALHNSHNASVCEVVDNKIVYFQEAERIDKKKKSNDWKVLLKKYKNQNFDKVIFVNAFLTATLDINFDIFKKYLDSLDITYEEAIKENNHHFFHACCAYFNSGFSKSYVLVSDGTGSTDDESSEIVSLFYFNKNKFKKIFQFYMTSGDEKIESKNVFLNTLSLGKAYQDVQTKCSFKEPGSVMGFSCYLKESDNYQPVFFKEKLNHFQSIADTFYIFMPNIRRCFYIQKDLEYIVLKYVKNVVKNKNRNLCVSGGTFQNTVLNSKILDICPNLYVDPFADDSGLSMGAALWYANKDKFTNKKINNLFLGDTPNYTYLNLNEGYNVEPIDIAKILTEKLVVGIYQGRNELGKRALGNRSFLFDPRDFFAKEKINLLKNREWFRPTAGTILHEHAKEWFDLKTKKETPFMSYVFKVKKEIPGVTHIDNTCRIQTVTQKQNFHYYNLIKEFYKLTGVPILVNTSLNLAGQPLVNEIKDLEIIFKNSKLQQPFDYIYFPEIKKMYTGDYFRKNVDVVY